MVLATPLTKRPPPAEGAEAAGFWAVRAEGPRDRDRRAARRFSLLGFVMSVTTAGSS